MDKHCDTICDDHSQRDQHPFIAYDNFKTLTMHQRDEMVRKTPSAGSPGVGDKNPLLHTMWNELAFKEAQAGGPHMDATGQPDARTVEHVEQVGLSQSIDDGVTSSFSSMITASSCQLWHETWLVRIRA